MSRQLDRRAFLRRGAAGAAALAVGPGLLAACSTDRPRSEGKTGAGASPRSGGTLRAAFVGGGASESLDFFNGPSALDLVRARAWHGTLGNLDPSGADGVRYGVLKGIDISDDLSTYTLHVRPGVRFTDGSELTSADILHSLSALAAKSTLPVYRLAAADFDLAHAKADGDLKVVLPTLRPIADGRMVLCQGNFLVVKNGTKAFREGMPSCGPFRLTDFAAGQGSAFERYDDHYGHVPLLDGLELRSIADSTARAGALTSGDIDFAHDLSPVTARTLDDNGKVELVPTKSPYLVGLSFQMNMSAKPFDDPRVREAFKLAADRQTMVKTVFHGNAQVGNDLPSIGFPDYAQGLPQRAHDPERARVLLKEAGADGMKVTLTTGPETPGMVEMATLFVEDLKKVGVRASVRELPAGQLYADFPAYAALPLAGSYQMPVPALSTYQMSTAGGSPSAFGWKESATDALVAEARAESDSREAKRVGTQAQRRRWEDGNQVLPVFKPNLNAQAKGVSGVRDDLFEQFPGFSQASLA
ncbi:MULTISPECIES: ABC transporter substrate-binding protein [unclassified Streptomyces]|uniref:ABC transporter substrate-binding protein n=1 Tax=unclassified Streptomyces TaxID=2593676 RepID=UPI0001C1D001|nr:MULTISPECIES: ABC transporter substrate-binding protein [unclassified Streptomyces]AEN08677.1 extracellular solute-binding protein family 5 [Streptomyces sp. SirexAA-E]MYR64947.1 ABC transporter substrate-binding protein [Streptomyces sp. SID4939]MYS04073.1 ABC transporter substrate-binding protein [Streptomyces sp. SID4940]MYT65551.1 ABC transporter substrate-binding protein [Streptomyces sp. SID8357]MYT89020.1 ABC transporter substrate-binding protein [Streptomyces sp. SID8360]